MNDKVRTINIDGIEVQTSLTPLELADLSQKYAELQSNWNSLRKWLEALKNYEETKDKMFYIGNIQVLQDVLDKMNELEGKDNN